MRRTARTAADGVGARGWLEMGGEKKPLVMNDLGCADGCGRQMGGRTARMAADGVGATEWLEMGGEKGKKGKGWERKGQEGKGRDRKGKEGKGWERKEKGRERKGKEGKGRERKGKEGKGRERKGKDGKGRERKGKDGKGTEKDGKGSERNGADGCGRPGCKGVAGNGWGEEAAGDERAWLRGRLRTGNGCGEVRGRLWMARVQRRGWKWMGRRSRW